MSDFVHADKPLIDESEYQFRTTSPAYGVSVSVVFYLVEDLLVAQLLEDQRIDLVNRFT